MGRVYLGIDPGSKGFITLMSDEGMEFFSIEDNDFYKLGDILHDIKERYSDVICVMEEVHAIFGSSAKGTFNFGEINGLLKGLLIANKIPYHLVQPKTWQKEIWDNKDMVYLYKMSKDGKKKKVVNTKPTSFNSAKRLFPNVDFRKTTRCKKDDDNKIDSLLICEYGRRKNL
jgi:hypothetical protein